MVEVAQCPRYVFPTISTAGGEIVFGICEVNKSYHIHIYMFTIRKGSHSEESLSSSDSVSRSEWTICLALPFMADMHENFSTTVVISECYSSEEEVS